MEKFLSEIVENHKSDRYTREIYQFEDIEITVLQNGDKIVVWGFNYKSQRFLNLGSKKYSILITGFKEIAKDLYSKEGKYYITLDNSIKSVISNKVIGYARVSTRNQLDGNSLEQQLGLITNRYPTAIVYEESKSSMKERKVFKKVIEALNEGDTLVVTTLDRFCRTVKEGLEIIDLLMDKGVRIHILNMGLIEDTPMGRLIVTNLLAFAEFERSMIVERTQTGKAIAKTKEGWKEGRPKLYTNEQLDNALSMLTVNGGNRSYKEVERLLGISKSTLIRENSKRKFENDICR
ncbi:MAG: recombinase family protein [Clostridium sp.]|jgi:DNA invertase Pin-like site-specific DNA recombinase|uniref:recombinase family protein n=1 Tax=unclassified Clostridium TaxID=2614128 RepID=UPI001C8C424B|nr:MULTISPECIES: recombinase family protein [unclassified Clostridium]MBX9138460.1 recombinase family protein [Clostridium sp. K12(2020)]MBX9145211.1 recombinase family protein [Clostridium sp. K13]